jgi:hypothetical protein
MPPMVHRRRSSRAGGRLWRSSASSRPAAERPAVASGAPRERSTAAKLATKRCRGEAEAAGWDRELAGLSERSPAGRGGGRNTVWDGGAVLFVERVVATAPAATARMATAIAPGVRIRLIGARPVAVLDPDPAAGPRHGQLQRAWRCLSCSQLPRVRSGGRCSRRERVVSIMLDVCKQRHSPGWLGGRQWERVACERRPREPVQAPSLALVWVFCRPSRGFRCCQAVGVS